MCLNGAHESVKNKCMELARNGNRKAKIGIGFDGDFSWNYEVMDNKTIVARFANEMVDLLREDGFESIKFRIKRHRGYNVPFFSATFWLSW